MAQIGNGFGNSNEHKKTHRGVQKPVITLTVFFYRSNAGLGYGDRPEIPADIMTELYDKRVVNIKAHARFDPKLVTRPFANADYKIIIKGSSICRGGGGDGEARA